jgi:hypothetical protein
MNPGIIINGFLYDMNSSIVIALLVICSIALLIGNFGEFIVVMAYFPIHNVNILNQVELSKTCLSDFFRASLAFLDHPLAAAAHRQELTQSISEVKEWP